MSRLKRLRVDKEIAALLEVRESTVEQCEGCVSDKKDFCECYAFPKAKWRDGNCVRASHFRADLIEEEKKKRVGQQKQRR